MKRKEIIQLQEKIVFQGIETAEVVLEQIWDHDICRCYMHNKGTEAVAIKEVVLFGGAVDLPEDTEFYGEGYNMLSQYGGSIGCPQNIGAYGDADHYKMPVTEGYFTVYNMLILYHEHEICDLIGFTSCRRFSNEIRIAPDKIQLVLDMEGLVLEGGETWELEELFVVFETDRKTALDRFADQIARNHPRLSAEEIPTGWCSWLCYGPGVTKEDILVTLNDAKEHQLPMKYIQIDDGYQPYMGDWLMDSNTFSCTMKELCREIKEMGYEPAMWVAPFIAEKDSRLFQEHPDWFIRDEEGKPLASDRVSFGGWRRHPWYMLDGTHPEAQGYIRHVFQTMRNEWGCHYFKLDAITWEALPFGTRYDPKATRVTAFRQGMKALLDGAGENCFLLGGNSPMWPSIGMLHAMRITNDCSRKWERFKNLANENFHRLWQHENLWINDPDCILLENRSNAIMGAGGEALGNRCSVVTEDEFSFHKAVILASGSMVLSGDRLTDLSEASRNVLRKLLKAPKIPAVFEDRSFKVGRICTETEELLCLFNWEDDFADQTVSSGDWNVAEDYWSEEHVACVNGEITLMDIPPHSARVIRLSKK